MKPPGTCSVAARAVLVLALVLCAPLSPAAESPPAGPRPGRSEWVVCGVQEIQERFRRE